MESLSTPDVYIQEVPTLPPSVAEVSTAVPVFIGHTQQALRGDVSLQDVPVRIDSLQAYRQYFGGPDPRKYKVTVEAAEPPYKIKIDDDAEPTLAHQLFYSLEHFFKNGGSDCYVLSIGSYTDKKLKTKFSNALATVAKEDEPTLIVLSEACSLGPADYYELCTEALRQCKTLMDRFCLIDVLDIGTDGKATAFKTSIGTGTDNLKYGAAYYPFLQTSIGFHYEDKGVTLGYTQQEAALKDTLTDTPAAKNATETLTTPSLPVADTPTPPAPALTAKDPAFTVTPALLTITVERGTRAQAVVDAWEALPDSAKDKFTIGFLSDQSLSEEDSKPLPKNKTTPAGGIEVTNNGSASAKLVVAVTAAPVSAPRAAATQVAGATAPLSAPGAVAQTTTTTATVQSPIVAATRLDEIKDTKTGLYNAIKQRLSQETVTLPPSPAVAGVYATVDRERGVWKAPANVSLSAVVGPAQKINADQQARLNIDPDSGKSINAIRSFTGKGTLIWGARTLAGNDNEWRYISVRRLFSMVEESAKKASFFAVFEPNDASTWLKVRGMIESYLYTLWQQGALAGPSPKAAYYVRVGLGTTMTTDDVNNGKMKIEIGLAAVRPAEFIVLSFSHKLQEA
jgi:phage tail sheath protein FI